MVAFVDVSDIVSLIGKIGVEPLLAEIATCVEADYRRWPEFEKAPRLASREGVIGLMPESEGQLFSFNK